MCFIWSCVGGREFYYTQHIKIENESIINIMVDKEFGGKDKEEIRGGINDWNKSLNGRIILKVVDWNYDMKLMKEYPIAGRDTFYIVRVNSEEARKIYYKINDGILAFASRRGGRITYFIWDRLEGENLKYTTLHEIGHLLGADHKGEKLMNATYNKKNFSCIDYQTALQVATYWGIKVSEMNWCLDY